jgi:hypothetical protein
MSRIPIASYARYSLAAACSAMPFDRESASVGRPRIDRFNAPVLSQVIGPAFPCHRSFRQGD